MSYCPECGEKIEGNPKFCSRCGNKLFTDDSDASSVNSTKIEEEISPQTKPVIKKGKKPIISQPSQLHNKLTWSAKKKLTVVFIAIIIFIVFLIIVINLQQQNNSYYQYYNNYPSQHWVSVDTFEVNTYSDWHQFYPPSSGQWKISWERISGEWPFTVTIYRGTWVEPPISPEYVFDEFFSYDNEKIYASYETNDDVYTLRAGYYEGEQSSGGIWQITIWSYM
jgi:uncharacterized integral membrane protein